jgi:hypothetical protein
MFSNSKLRGQVRLDYYLKNLDAAGKIQDVIFLVITQILNTIFVIKKSSHKDI